VLVGAAAGVVLSMRVRGHARRAAGAIACAVLAGAVAVAVLHGCLGTLTGDRLVESAVVCLGLAATSLGVLGVGAVAGPVPALRVVVLTCWAAGGPLLLAVRSLREHRAALPGADQDRGGVG
jgi:hypothetical protein